MRDQFTWLSYFMMAFFAYQQAAIGPLMPFLRDELNMSYTVGSLHLSAFAAGSVMIGVFGRKILAYFGRTRVFWGSGVFMGIGTLIFLAGPHPAVTIAGTFIMGINGSALLVVLHAGLGDAHRNFRGAAVTEANISAIGCAMIAPLMIGLAESIGVGWRVAVILIVFVYAGVWLRYHTTAVPPPPIKRDVAASTAEGETLPPLYWAYWVFVLVGVSIEWCVGFWGADYLQTEVGLEKALASSLMSVYLGGMLVSRVVASRLTRRYPAQALLPGAIVLTAIGFPLFWLGTAAPINVLGLFIAGLGIANFFPLGYAAAANAAPDNQDAASARLSLSAGLAIMIMPQVMGIVADAVQIKTAFGVVIVLLVALAVVTWRAQRVQYDEPMAQAFTLPD